MLTSACFWSPYPTTLHLKTHFNIIVPSVSKLSPPITVPDQNFPSIFKLCRVYYMHHPSHSPSFNYRNMGRNHEKSSILTNMQTAYGDFKDMRVSLATNLLTAKRSDLRMWYRTPSAWYCTITLHRNANICSKLSGCSTRCAEGTL